jgi:hypothetical protein
MALAGIDDLLIGIDETVRMTLINPFNGSPCINRDTEENGWIDVMSDTSDAGAAYMRARNNRVLARGGRAATDEELQFENVEKAAALVTGWSLVAPNGSPINLAWSRATARELFGNRKARWMRDQVLEFSANLGNYRPTTSPDSSPTPNTTSGSTAA